MPILSIVGRVIPGDHWDAMSSSAGQVAQGLPPVARRSRASHRIGELCIQTVSSHWFWTANIVIIFASAAAWFMREPLNGDLAWLLYTARRFAHGPVVYNDTNPPLVFLLQVPTVWASEFLKMPLSGVFFLGQFLLVTGVLLYADRALRLTTLARNFSSKWVVIVIAAATLSFDRRDFGQKDVIAAGLMVPIAIAYVLRMEGLRPPRLPTLCASITAGVAISLKPHFFIPWLLISLCLIHRVSLRCALRAAELWLVPATTGAVTGALVISYPGFYRAAWKTLQYYNAFNNPLSYFQPLLPAFLLAIVAFVWQPLAAKRHLIRISSLAAIGFILSALLQRKAFPYHLAAAEVWSLITAGILFLDFIDRLEFRRASMIAGAVAILLSLGSGLTAAAPVDVNSPVDSYIQQNARGKTVLALSTDLWTSFPILYEADARLELDNPALWIIPAMYQDQVRPVDSQPESPTHYHTPAEMSPDEREAFDHVIHVMQSDHPSMILVDNRRFKQALGNMQFDFIDYFATDAQFREELSHYALGPTDARSRLYLRLNQ